MRNLRKAKLMMWLMVLTMLVSVIGIVPAAMAAGDYTALKVPVLVDDPDFTQALGGVKIEVQAGALKEGDALTISLPDDITMPEYTLDWFVADNDPEIEFNMLYVPNYVGAGEDNGITADMVDVISVSDDEIQIRLNADAALTKDAYMYLYLREVIVNNGASGDAVLTFEAASNSGFKNGELVVGKIGTGDVTVTVIDQETSNSDFDVTIRIKENVAGALKVDDESLKFVLPDGFVWKTGFGYTHKWGDNLAGDFSINIEDNKLTFDFEGAPTFSPASFELVFSFEVSDETKAEAGDILVNVSGKSALAGSDELVVGTYGEYGGVIEIRGEVPTVLAGQLEQ
ncbi:MAG: hypothetical protein GX602_06475, partial [Dehalococcoidales bacterium]|nr:hypothetical protein [Dehalococcoidales bacterium]